MPETKYRTNAAVSRRPRTGGRQSQAAVAVPADESPLESALAGLFTAYARHFLVGERPLPPFCATLEGPFVLLTVQAPDGPQSLRRRASAFLLLAGHFWGACRSAEERALLPALLATLTRHPHGDRDGWANAQAFESDAAARGALIALADALRPVAADEAALVLQRLFGADAGWGGAPSVEALDLHPELLAEMSTPMRWRPPAVAEPPRAFARRLIRRAASQSDRERLSAAADLASMVHALRDGAYADFVPVAEAMLDHWLSDRDGAVFESALGLAQELGAKLLYGGAYDPAARLLDRIVPHHVAPTETLRQRWECRAFAGDPGADEDWARASLLDGPDDPAYLGRCLFWAGDVIDRQAVASSRVANALVLQVEAGLPRDEAHADGARPGDAPVDPTRDELLARAKAFAEHAVDAVAARTARTLDQAKKEGAAPGQGFRAEAHAARARVHEASGELAEALDRFRLARRLRIAGGLPWQSDHFGADVRRLERRLRGACPDAVPASFDPAWLLDARRTPTQRDAAVARWALSPWRELSRSPSSGQGGALASSLLREVIVQSRDLWRDAARHGIDLGDRLAFADRALRYVDAWQPRRDTQRLAQVLRAPLSVAFPAATATTHHAAERATFLLLVWVESLTKAAQLDERTVLVGLRGRPWSHLRAHLAERVAAYDPLRDLFDQLHAAGLDGDGIAHVLRAYDALAERDWPERSRPDPCWAKLAAPLASLDATKLVPCLVAWTLEHQAPAAHEGGSPLRAKWLWPLYFARSTELAAPFLAAVRRGELDAGATPTARQARTRHACLEALSVR